MALAAAAVPDDVAKEEVIEGVIEVENVVVGLSFIAVVVGVAVLVVGTVAVPCPLFPAALKNCC